MEVKLSQLELMARLATVSFSFIIVSNLLVELFYYNQQQQRMNSLLLKSGSLLFCSQLVLLFKGESISLLSFIYKLSAVIYLLQIVFNNQVTEKISVREEVETENQDFQQEMIQELKAQRHDFKNELQMIYTMLQLDKTKEAKEYIKNLQFDLKETTISQEYNTDLKPVLLCKQQKARENNIDLDFTIDLPVKNIKLPYDKLIKILFNLVDNALEAVQEKEANRKVKVELVAQDNQASLRVYNNGPVIPSEIQDNIFAPGYTTKQQGSGFGLHIVQSLVRKYNGRIDLRSEEDFGTEFICYLPQKK